MQSKPKIAPAQTFLERASNVLSHYVLPLYRTDPFERPDQIGSGFIVRLEGMHYLVTAAHVLDYLNQGGLYFYTSASQPTPVSGRARRSGRGQSSDADQLDVAVVQLDQVIPAPPYRDIEKIAVDIHEMRPRLLPRTTRSYLLLGFPSTKNEFRRVDGEVRATAYTYHGESPHSIVYERLALAEHQHVLLKFEQRVGYDKDGKQIVFPKPQGMSGGPIVLYSSDQPNDFDFGFPIVAVATRHKGGSKVIQGTDISVAIQFIGELHAG